MMPCRGRLFLFPAKREVVSREGERPFRERERSFREKERGRFERERERERPFRERERREKACEASFALCLRVCILFVPHNFMYVQLRVGCFLLCFETQSMMYLI